MCEWWSGVVVKSRLESWGRIIDGGVVLCIISNEDLCKVGSSAVLMQEV